MSTNNNQSVELPVIHEYRRLVCSHCGQIVDVPIFCGDRFCPVCSGPRRARFKHRIESIVKLTKSKPGFRWRFITLTIPNSRDVAKALDTIYSSFRKLRSRQFWKSAVDGGICGAEVTSSATGFHVHLHILAFSRFIPQHQLAQQWKACSPGKIVDIRLIPVPAVAGYLAQYITKTELPDDVRLQVSDAFRNRRLFTVFGTCHDLKIPREKHPFPCKHCQHTDWMPLDRVLRDPGIVCDRASG